MRTVIKIALGVLLGGLTLILLLGALAFLFEPVPVDEGPGSEGTDAGSDYCSAEKQDEIAALRLDDGDTINDPKLLRKATNQFIRATDDAPKGAWCVDQQRDGLVQIWNLSRGDPGSGDAARQVKRLRDHP